MIVFVVCNDHNFSIHFAISFALTEVKCLVPVQTSSVVAR